MDAIDILGSLLGHKSSKPGKGSDVLKDIFGGGSRSRPSSSGPPKPADIARQSKELEDLLNVANGRQTQRSAPSRSDAESQRRSTSQDRQDNSGQNERALILVQAMINAAKSDGKIDPAEQETILKRLSDRSPSTIEFLRTEFAKPLNVREFCASIPIGMEQQVYTMSLIAIDLDTGQEAKYLMDLANGLRLDPDVREQIHQRLGAPSVY